MKPVERSSTHAASEGAKRLVGRSAVGITLLVTAWLGRPATAFAQMPKEVCIEAATQGQRARDEGHWLEAREQFLMCAAARCPGLVRSECARWLSEVEAQLPSVVLGARSATGDDLTAVRIQLDGRPFMVALDGRPRAIDPGAHRLVFEAEGHRSSTVEVMVRAGESARVIVATLEPKPTAQAGARLGAAGTEATTAERAESRPSAPSYAAPLWILGGLAVASAGAATALVAYAHEEEDALSSGCSPRCSDGDTRPLRTSLAFANVAAVTSLLSLGGLTYFLVKRASAPSATTSSPPPSAPPRVAVLPMFGPGAGGAFAILRF